MLFFSSEESEVELVRRELAEAGLPCEIRRSPVTESPPGPAPSSELWIQEDKDCHKALVVCVERGIGFSKRTAQPGNVDTEFFTNCHGVG